jgi:hypothetical protein
MTQGGVFHPLKPGTRIQTLGEPQDVVVPEIAAAISRLFRKKGQRIDPNTRCGFLNL